MKKYLINFLLLLVILIVTFISTGFSFNVSQGLLDQWGLPHGIGMLFSFLFMSIISGISLSNFRNRTETALVLIVVALPILFLFISNVLNSSINIQLKIIPFYISWILGVVAGFLYSTEGKKRIKLLIILAIFPTLMAFNVYELWIHKIEYGNWTGEIEATPVSAFEFLDKENESITNESLKGKVVLFDFWFIGCPPCWVKFPDLQRIYDQYQSDDRLMIYAVNRPMRRDKEGELYTSIEEKGYTFPVLLGTQEILDSLNIYKYPTVMILNEKGNMVFMGELEDAEDKLKVILAN